MEKVSAAFEHTLEHPQSKKRARSKPSSFWSGHLSSFQITSLPHLRLAAAAVLLFALSLIAWAVLQSKSEKSQLAGAQPPETVSPDPSQQPTVPGQTAPSIGPEVGKKVEDSTPNQVLEKREFRCKEDEFERVLIAKNLTMPPAIEVLDRTPAIAVRGNPSFNPSFKILRPFATLVKNDRPMFQWTPLSGATSYVVSVFDAALNLIRTSEPLTDTQWLIPEPLKAGIVYTWTVTALKEGQEIVAPPPPARAEFKILGKPEWHTVNRAISRLKSHAARGVVYAEAGLLDEAAKEFRTRLSLQPTNQRVKKLLEVIESWRVAK